VWLILFFVATDYFTGSSVSYRIGSGSIQKIDSDIATLQKLKSLQGKKYWSSRKLLSDVEDKIGEKPPRRLVSLIFKYAKSARFSNPKLVFVLVAVFIGAAVWFWLLRSHDRFEPEPIKFVIWVAIVGGLISTNFAGWGNWGFGELTGWSLRSQNPLKNFAFGIFVGVNEETWKFLATYWLIRNSKEYNEPIDALIYGMTVALGFAAFENVYYVWNSGLDLAFSRSLITVPGHMCLAAIWSYGMAELKFKEKNSSYLKSVIPYLALAAVIHGLYDFLVSQRHWAFVYFAILVVLIMLLYFHQKLIYLSGQSLFLKVGECHICRSINSPQAKYCQKCGTSMDKTFYRICHHCNIRVARNEKNCPKCGQEIASIQRSKNKP